MGVKPRIGEGGWGFNTARGGVKTSLGQLFLKYIDPKIWPNIPEKLKSSSPYSFGKKYKKSPAILPDFLLIFVFYACHIL